MGLYMWQKELQLLEKRIKNMNNKCKNSHTTDRVSYYFKSEWHIILIITISGLIYNIGLLAGPWFEGRMTGCLVDILGGDAVFTDMLTLVIFYVLSIAVVQISRYIKRFYVRRFSNNVNRNMKEVLYNSLVHKTRLQLHEEGAGDILTKAILDVDDCAEGMRKFTTEIFDTGVALTAYAGMLLFYDWRLALISMIFPPVSYILAEKMKTIVQKTGAEYKVQSGKLSAATLDRAGNAVTYRVYGCEQERKQAYEDNLSAYEHSAVKANIWGTAFPPIYRVISLAGVIFILYFGSRNVLGMGWKSWNIAALTTFISCFAKLSEKSSHAAKLFNAVHKAQVSWKRIKPFMKYEEYNEADKEVKCDNLDINDLTFAYPGNSDIFENVTLDAKKGDIIGVTGAVASGKSTFGKVFLCEYPYNGSIRIDGDELDKLDDTRKAGLVAYLGHDPELFNDTVKNNILMGKNADITPFLKDVCFENEVNDMENGQDTIIGNMGVRLSGGQAQRLALARTLCHKKPLIILDDPFSALDKQTEKEVFNNMKKYTSDSIVILISHRLYLFPQMDKVVWIDKGKAEAGTHEEIMKKCPKYAALYNEQKGGETDAG